MNSRQAQAWFLIRLLRGQNLLVEASDEAVKISSWPSQRPREIDSEVMETVRCLRAELLLILRLEQRVMLARSDDRSRRPRRNRWKYQRGNQ